MESMNKRFMIKDAFFSPLEEKIRTVVLPYQEAVLKDEVEGVAKSHAVENFRAAAEVLKKGKCDTEFYGMVFQDSDVAKWQRRCPERPFRRCQMARGRCIFTAADTGCRTGGALRPDD